MNLRSRICFCAISAIFAAGGLMSGTVRAADATEDQRALARLIARIETPLASRDQKAYCRTFYGNKDYRSYVGRACEAGVKMGVRKPQECTAKAVADQAKADQEKCLAMDGKEFDATVAKQAEARSKFVKEVGAQGVDGEKLIAEEREKLRKK